MALRPADFECAASTGSAILTRKECEIVTPGVQVSEFDYELPTELIAQHPVPQRSASRVVKARLAGRKASGGKIELSSSA